MIGSRGGATAVQASRPAELEAVGERLEADAALEGWPRPGARLHEQRRVGIPREPGLIVVALVVVVSAEIGRMQRGDSALERRIALAVIPSPRRLDRERVAVVGFVRSAPTRLRDHRGQVLIQLVVE